MKVKYGYYNRPSGILNQVQYRQLALNFSKFIYLKYIWNGSWKTGLFKFAVGRRGLISAYSGIAGSSFSTIAEKGGMSVVTNAVEWEANIGIDFTEGNY